MDEQKPGCGWCARRAGRRDQGTHRRPDARLAADTRRLTFDEGALIGVGTLSRRGASGERRGEGDSGEPVEAPGDRHDLAVEEKALEPGVPWAEGVAMPPRDGGTFSLSRLNSGSLSASFSSPAAPFARRLGRLLASPDVTATGGRGPLHARVIRQGRLYLKGRRWNVERTQVAPAVCRPMES